MSAPVSFGREAERLHLQGDLHIQGAGHGGYSAVWWCGEALEAASRLGVSSGAPSTRVEALEQLSGFLTRAAAEWMSSNRLSGLGELVTLPKDETQPGVETFLAEISVPGSYTFLDLPAEAGLSGQIIEALSEDARAEGRLRGIVPICPLGGEHPETSFFTQAGVVGLPIFRAGEKAEEEAHGLIGAITLNVPRAAAKARDEDAFIDEIGRLMEASAAGIDSKRRSLEVRIRQGEMPVTAAVTGGLERFAGSIGVIGINEALKVLMDKGIETKQGKAVAYKLLEYMAGRSKELGEKHGTTLQIHATPTDEASYRLARLDKEKSLNIPSQGSIAPFYTESTMLPCGYTDDLWDALEHQKGFMSMYTGGSIFNIHLAGPVRDIGGLAVLADRIRGVFGISNFEFSPIYSVCSIHGYVEGRAMSCPTCGRETRTYSRSELVYKPEDEMSPGELEEVRLRRPYAVASGW